MKAKKLKLYPDNTGALLVETSAGVVLADQSVLDRQPSLPPSLPQVHSLDGARGTGISHGLGYFCPALTIMPALPIPGSDRPDHHY